MPLAPPPGIAASKARPGPPGEAPPPPPPGFGSPPGSPAPATGTSSPAPGGYNTATGGPEMELRREILAQIEQQVASRVDEVRAETEQKVKVQLKSIYGAMQQLDKQLDSLLTQLDSIPVPELAEPALDAATVSQLLNKIEQQWGHELKTLKQELNQTIVAHNHNADLIKAHKDNIDKMTEQSEKLPTSAARKTEIQTAMKILDQKLKQKGKQPKLEPLWERLTALENKINKAMNTGGWGGYGGMPPLVPPGMALPPGIGGANFASMMNASLMAQAGVAAKAAAANKAKANAVAAALRAAEAEAM
eukprot:TRINITY_DN102494_c0_g1_i1.p2 TRINITY_DN102494_c0_g1~~TRINITY_DN102494_c0_g1_i1.p2  ORF type:complete len:305 (+),score=109.37 TRINITY_DN102494_c0_g1_i1:130-1044(+)